MHEIALRLIRSNQAKVRPTGVSLYGRASSQQADWTLLVDGRHADTLSEPLAGSGFRAKQPNASKSALSVIQSHAEPKTCLAQALQSVFRQDDNHSSAVDMHELKDQLAQIGLVDADTRIRVDSGEYGVYPGVHLNERGCHPVIEVRDAGDSVIARFVEDTLYDPLSPGSESVFPASTSVDTRRWLDQIAQRRALSHQSLEEMGAFLADKGLTFDNQPQLYNDEQYNQRADMLIHRLRQSLQTASEANGYKLDAYALADAGVQCFTTKGGKVFFERKDEDGEPIERASAHDSFALRQASESIAQRTGVETSTIMLANADQYLDIDTCEPRDSLKVG